MFDYQNSLTLRHNHQSPDNTKHYDLKSSKKLIDEDRDSKKLQSILLNRKIAEKE